uniref:Single stranded DNA binding protein 4 n=1 Tax=Mus musculus TaxID=10090 RepID=A0A1B0GRS0_MOUSE
MYGKASKGCAPSDGQAREKLALYVYEYLLHVGAQKSAQTFLSEIRWEKNITLASSGTCIVRHQTAGRPVNTPVRPKSSRTIAQQQLPAL